MWSKHNWSSCCGTRKILMTVSWARFLDHIMLFVETREKRLIYFCSDTVTDTHKLRYQKCINTLISMHESVLVNKQIHIHICFRATCPKQIRFTCTCILTNKHTHTNTHTHTQVLLNVAKLTQIAGKYFEHAFPLKTSSVYCSKSREVSGNVVLGLRLDTPD